MVKNKGFTLIELLGVISILGIIMLVAVPGINNSITSSKKQTYEAYEKNLYLATETYIQKNREKYPELDNVGGRVFIQIQQLIDAGLISEVVYNPYTGVEISKTDTISATVKEDKTIQYNYNVANAATTGYNQNGLILHLDAINNSGNGHVASVSNWKNISNNTLATKINGATFGDSVITKTNSVNIIADAPKNNDNKIQTQINNVSKNWTVEEHISVNKSNGEDLILSWTDGKEKIYYANLLKNGFFETTYAINYKGEEDYNGKTLTVTTTYDGTKIEEYINGKLINEANMSNLEIGDMYLVIGQYRYEGEAKVDSDIEYHSIRYYDRKLTEEEIKQNYEIDKIRFGD